jgi:hypothetical protein
MMSTMSMTRTTAAIVLALAAAGCARPAEYKAPVQTFRDASAVVITSTQTFLSAMNKTERDHYISDQVASQAPIQLNRIEEVQVFGPDAIAARMSALDDLAAYTDLLYKLATSDSPDAIKAQAKDLGTALTNLSSEAASLSNTDNEGFKRSVTAVTPVLGDVLQAIVQQKTEDALRKAVTTGAAPVNNLIDAIKVDAEVAYQRKRSALSKRRADAVQAYNVAVQRGTTGSLNRLGDAIIATEDQFDAFRTAKPDTGLEAMKQANVALEKFARTPHPRQTDVAAFVDAMELFAAVAARLGQDVQQLRELQRGAR